NKHPCGSLIFLFIFTGLGILMAIQKAQIAAALEGAQSKETLAKHLQQIMQMIEKNKAHREDPTSSAESSSDYNQNEDDCFGINLGED
ncbi:hypothetical protein HN51_058295, partial [Arachis hypogaea]